MTVNDLIILHETTGVVNEKITSPTSQEGTNRIVEMLQRSFSKNLDAKVYPGGKGWISVLIENANHPVLNKSKFKYSLVSVTSSSVDTIIQGNDLEEIQRYNIQIIKKDCPVYLIGKLRGKNNDIKNIAERYVKSFEV